ncbi:hypothetical protein S83_020625 [Arachis hypogaea]
MLEFSPWFGRAKATHNNKGQKRHFLSVYESTRTFIAAFIILSFPFSNNKKEKKEKEKKKYKVQQLHLAKKNINNGTQREKETPQSFTEIATNNTTLRTSFPYSLSSLISSSVQEGLF